MVDFAIITEEAKQIDEAYNERLAVLKAADTKETLIFDVIPADIYDGQTADEGENSELEKRYQQLTCSYLERQFPLLIDLNNALIILNRLQAISLEKHQSVMNENVTKENAMKKVFVLAVAEETRITYMFAEGIREQLKHSAATIEHFGLSFSEEESDITRFCKEAEEVLNKGNLSATDFAVLLNETYSNLCSSYNALAKLTLEKMDVELGYLYHCSENKKDAELLAIKMQAFECFAEDIDSYQTKTFELLEAIQRHNSPKQSAPNSDSPAHARH